MINAIRKQNEAVRNLLESSREFYKLSSKDSLGNLQDACRLRTIMELTLMN